MSRVDELVRIGREVNEIIFAAPLPRLRDEDGTEWVDRDALAAKVREHIGRRVEQAKRDGAPR